MKKIIILLLSVLINQGLYSQKLAQTIRGKVVDSQTEAPLVGVVVIIKNTIPVLGARTDTEGNFKIDKVPVGRQTVEFSHIGYLSYAQENIFITSNKETDLYIKLEESVTTLNEVFVIHRLKKE
jgi:hypothetical protein